MMPGAYKSPQPLRLFPEKLFYKIGEVSKLVGVESYVLRYWETEFPFLKPRKSKSGQRIYTKADIDLILQIKKLLYEEKYTIDGVRRRFGDPAGEPETVTPPVEVTEREQQTERPVVSADAEKILTLVKSRLREILHLHFGA
ncbi:MAG: MerR family transcriptional regulator [Nitrospirota bacterium]